MLEDDHTLMNRPDELGPVDQGKQQNFQAYILRSRSDQATIASDWANHPFILQEVSGQQPPQHFDNFEQVMNFLLDELLKYRR
jgi:hypothetical protein